MRAWVTLIAATSFVLAGGNLTATAVTGPTVTIANTGNALVGSSISNFDPSETLRLELKASAGNLTVDLGTSGALLAPGGALTGGTVAITGTQDQLNAALATTTMSDSCTTTRSITAYVVEGANAMYLDTDNSHWYAEVVTGGDSWDTDKTNADAMTLPHSTGHGYLATVTTAAENTFLNSHFADTPMFGASDAALEGDWYWMDGPETGTKFYTNGAPVAGQYTNFNSGEPNNSNGNEDYGQLWTGDTWNDISGDNRYLVEFGGLTGDSFAGVLSATATASLTVVPVLSGAGTSASPFLVATSADLSQVTKCSGAGVYFKQTADIAVAPGFQTGGDFSGHYDGDGKTIDLNALGGMSAGLFGTVSGATLPSDTTFANVTIDGSDLQNRACVAGTFARNIQNATIDHVNFNGGSTSVHCEGGIFANSIQNSLIENSTVSGTMSVEFDLFMGGGLAGNAQNSTFSNVNCNVDFGDQNMFPFFDVEFFGGCLGDSSQNIFHRVSFTGNLDFTMGNGPAMAMAVGGIAGRSSQDKFEQDSATGTIKVDYGDSIGLFAGFTQESTTTESVSAGQIITSDGMNVGGFFGNASATSISDSYSSSSVSGSGNVGAIVGNMQSGSSLSNSYSSGLVTSSSNATHVLVGSSDNANITNSYWKVIAGGAAPTIESLGQEVPKYSGDLKKIKTFSDWNISSSPSSDNIWAICAGANGGYPYLAWQDLPGGCVRSFTSGASASVSGLAYVGNTLTANAVGWDPLATITYQWFAGDTPIAGSTSATLPIGPALKGVQLSVKIAGAKDGYTTMVASSAATKVADAPKSTMLVVGGFKANSRTVVTKSIQAIKKFVAGSGTVLTVKCDGFATAKKLTPAQKALANSRAVAVCSLITSANPGLTATKTSSVAKKSDKLPEGVRITVTAVKP